MGSITSYIPIVIWFIVSGLVTYLLKQQDSRMTNLENRMLDVNTQEEIRQMMNDNLLPIKEDVKEIKQRLTQLFDLQVETSNSNAASAAAAVSATAVAAQAVATATAAATAAQVAATAATVAAELIKTQNSK